MRLFKFLFAVMFIFFIGCGEDNPVDNVANNSDIPADPTNVSVPATTLNNLKPSAPKPEKTPGNESRIRINMIGMIDPATDQPITLVPNSNLFLTEDGKVKGLKVTTAGGNVSLNADLVFVVDNSGSMGEEADSIASKIITFVNYLETKGINLKVGCVGYDGNVTGALNLTSGANLSKYLNREYYSGTSRTYGFSGPDSASMENKANAMYSSSPYGENGIVGITFADSFFTWRSGAARVYINITDEPTQSDGKEFWNTESFAGRWSIDKGTVHTVFSVDSYDWVGSKPDTSVNNYYWNEEDERPWELSYITGGTIKFIHSDASDLDLTNLPVTGALSNSVLIEFLTADPNGTHDIEITVKNGNTADGKTKYEGIQY